MSKVIGIIAVFFVIIAVFALVFYYNIPKSLEIMKAEFVEVGQKNGFDVEIRDAKINSASVVEFEDISVVDFSKNVRAYAKVCKFEISLSDYIKAIFGQITKKEKVFLKKFSKKTSLENIVVKIAENEIFTDATAELFFENGNLRYVISGKISENSIFEVEDFSSFGIIEGGFCRVDSKFNIFGGEANVKGELDFQNISLKNPEIELNGIELEKLLPNFNFSGKLSAKINPQTENIVFNADFFEKIKETNADFSIKINNFKDLGSKYSKQILSNVAFAGIKSIDFAEISADVFYSPTKISTTNFLADNFKYSVSADGFYVPQSQNYDFSVGIHFNPDMKNSIQKNIWDVMTPDVPKNQGRFIGAKVYGEGGNFTISFDDEIMKRGVNSFLSSLKDIFK
ncbi:MAG: hypothetical protein FWF51_07150 [Chitinivibrionia bacterium]|nr:hypothetical protein [Chitinivibrionia bacterium]